MNDKSPPNRVITDEQIIAALLAPRRKGTRKAVIFGPVWGRILWCLEKDVGWILLMFGRYNREAAGMWLNSVRNARTPEENRRINHDPARKAKRQSTASWRYQNDPEYKADMLKRSSVNFQKTKPQRYKKRAEWLARDGNEEKMREWYRVHMNEKRRNDPWWKLRNRLASRLWHALQLQDAKKAFKTEELIGCTVEFCRKWIEQQFKPGMTWDNIHVDHIIPCVEFDLTKPSQQKKAFHYKNLQPLFAVDNHKKSDKMPTTQLPLI